MGTVSARKTKTGATRYKAIANTGAGNRESKTFGSKREALKWIDDTEETARLQIGNRAHGVLFGDALERYMHDVAPDKKGARWDITRCKKVMRAPLARVPLLEMSVTDALEHKELLLADGVCADTVIREFSLLKVVLRNCWDWYHVPYSWDGLKMPKRGRDRTRIAEKGELEKLIRASGFVWGETMNTTYAKVCGMFIIGCETGMRCGEMCGLRILDIDFTKQVARLSTTKNEDPRNVPLSDKAIQIISMLPERDSDEQLFAITGENVSATFLKIRRLAGLKTYDGQSLRFHDSRRVFCTNAAKIPKMTTLRLAQIIGHRNINQLATYFNDSAEEIGSDMREYQRAIDAGDDLGAKLATLGLNKDELRKALLAEG